MGLWKKLMTRFFSFVFSFSESSFELLLRAKRPSSSFGLAKVLGWVRSATLVRILSVLWTVLSSEEGEKYSNVVKCCSNVVKCCSNVVKCCQMLSNVAQMLLKCCQMLLKCCQMLSNVVKCCSNVAQMLSNVAQMLSNVVKCC